MDVVLMCASTMNTALISSYNIKIHKLAQKGKEISTTMASLVKINIGLYSYSRFKYYLVNSVALNSL